MILARCLVASIILSPVVWVLFAGSGMAQPAPKDAKDLLPNRKHQPLPGTAIGVLVSDCQPFLSTEGRSGPSDQLCFSTAGCSYRWVYVPVAQGAQITNLQVPVGTEGQKQVYASLDMARLRNVKSFGVETNYTLVEVQVNNGQGGPANDSFVATQIRVVEGTKEYPLKVADAVRQMKDKFTAHLKDKAKALDVAMAQAAKALKPDQKVTGPRETSEVMYVTWLPDSERLRVVFKSRITDGSFTFVDGGARNPPPIKGGPQIQEQPPPVPGGLKHKVGTAFGVDFGVAYEVDKTGQLVGTDVVPFADFVEQLQPPPGPRIDPPPARDSKL